MTMMLYRGEDGKDYDDKGDDGDDDMMVMMTKAMMVMMMTRAMMVMMWWWWWWWQRRWWCDGGGDDDKGDDGDDDVMVVVMMTKAMMVMIWWWWWWWWQRWWWYDGGGDDDDRWCWWWWYDGGGDDDDKGDDGGGGDENDNSNNDMAVVVIGAMLVIKGGLIMCDSLISSNTSIHKSLQSGLTIVKQYTYNTIWCSKPTNKRWPTNEPECKHTIGKTKSSSSPFGVHNCEQNEGERWYQSPMAQAIKHDQNHGHRVAPTSSKYSHENPNKKWCKLVDMHWVNLPLDINQVTSSYPWYKWCQAKEHEKVGSTVWREANFLPMFDLVWTVS